MEAATIGLPFARAVVSIVRTSQSTKPGAAAARVGERTFVTSLDKDTTAAARFATIARSHWSIENKNHWKRDAQWGEDKPRQKNAAAAMVLGVLRGALLALIREPCPDLFARCRRRQASALGLVTRNLPPLK